LHERWRRKNSTTAALLQLSRCFDVRKYASWLDNRALHLALFAWPSHLMFFCESIIKGFARKALKHNSFSENVLK